MGSGHGIIGLRPINIPICPPETGLVLHIRGAVGGGAEMQHPPGTVRAQLPPDMAGYPPDILHNLSGIFENIGVQPLQDVFLWFALFAKELQLVGLIDIAHKQLLIALISTGNAKCTDQFRKIHMPFPSYGLFYELPIIVPQDALFVKSGSTGMALSAVRVISVTRQPTAHSSTP